jgi:acyl carrier protein
MVAEHLSISVNKVKPESDFITDLEADSLDIVEMLMTLEDEMNIIIPDEVTGVKTVKDISDYIESVAG